MARSGSVCQGLAFNFKNYRGGVGSGSAPHGKAVCGMVGLFFQNHHGRAG